MATQRADTDAAFPDDATLSSVEEALRALTREAGGLVLERRPDLRVEHKGGNPSDPVTEVDRAVEAFLTAAVAERFPGHAVLGEEGQDPKGAHDWEWIVDPVDGTLNYVSGLPLYAISVGVLHRRRPVAGAILFPVTGELLWARRGGGAFREGEPLRVRPKERIGRPVAALPVGYGAGFRAAPGFQGSLGETRSLGSIAYELGAVAAGALDVAVFRGPKIWDVAAGAVLVAEAGGAVLAHSRRRAAWAPLEQFDAPRAGGLRAWSRPVLVASPWAAEVVSGKLAPRYAAPLLAAAGAAAGAAKRAYASARAVP